MDLRYAAQNTNWHEFGVGARSTSRDLLQASNYTYAISSYFTSVQQD